MPSSRCCGSTRCCNRGKAASPSTHRTSCSRQLHSRLPPRLQSLKGPPKGLSTMLSPLESSPVSVLSPGLWGRNQDPVCLMRLGHPGRKLRKKPPQSPVNPHGCIVPPVAHQGLLTSVYMISSKTENGKADIKWEEDGLGEKAGL